MELPDRLKDNGDKADSEEEVLRPQGYHGGMFMNMNQSIFGLIAAAGSQADFADRFEGQSSDDEDDGESPMAKTIAGHRALKLDTGGQGFPLARTTVLEKQAGAGAKADNRHRRKISESRLLRSVPGFSRLALRSSKSRSPKSPKVSSHEGGQSHETGEMGSASPPLSAVPPSIEITRSDTRTAPVMSRMLEARAELAMRPSFDLERLSGEKLAGPDADEGGPSDLARKLKEIFEFERAEEVIEGEDVARCTTSRT
jgi:sterol 3beta-glucosyltransferase